MSAVSYPPEDHVLRDLRFVTERDASGSRSTLDLVPALRTPAGSLYAGALATLVDLAGGEAALRAVGPAWVATSDLVLHVIRPLREGFVTARPALLRRSRSTAVIEVELLAGEAPQREKAPRPEKEPHPDDQPIGLATMTFAVLEPRAGSDVQRMGTGAQEPRTEFGREGSQLRGLLPQVLSVAELDAAAGVVQLPITPYVANSLGALQGGVVVMAVEFAALAIGRERLSAEVVVLDLAVNYLALVKVGPARTRARVLREDPSELLVRVELHDAGDGDRLCTVATVLLRVAP